MLTKRRTSNALLSLSMLALVAAQSCGAPGGGSAPSRPKLPGDFNGPQSIESNTSFKTQLLPGGGALYTGYVDMQTHGGAATYFTLSLPDDANDATILNMINLYRPLAVSLLSQWSQQQPYPVMIDLRATSGTDTRRADYMVQQPGTFSIPVVLIWDAASANRAGKLQQLLLSAHEIKVSEIANSTGITGGNF